MKGLVESDRQRILVVTAAPRAAGARAPAAAEQRREEVGIALLTAEQVGDVFRAGVARTATAASAGLPRPLAVVKAARLAAGLLIAFPVLAQRVVLLALLWVGE